MSNPYYPTAGPPPPGKAFPVLPPSGYGPAKTMSNAAAHKIALYPGSAKRNNLQGMERAANTYARLPPGTARARQGLKGNVYIEAKHLPVEGWGGEPEVLTHFSGHVSKTPKGPTFGPSTPAIGQFHAKTEGAEGERYLATAIPRGGPTPAFTYMATPARHLNKAYPSGNRSTEVAVGLAGAFSNYARLHPSGSGAFSGPKGQGYKGGRKSRKHSKKTRRGKTRKH